jgi:hypothetical protein
MSNWSQTYDEIRTLKNVPLNHLIIWHIKFDMANKDTCI